MKDAFVAAVGSVLLAMCASASALAAAPPFALAPSPAAASPAAPATSLSAPQAVAAASATAPPAVSPFAPDPSPAPRAVAAASAPAPSPTPQALAAEFLGFKVEEELRYVIGPPHSLYQGESGTWSIRLLEVFDTDDGPQGLFELQHEWLAPPASGEVPMRTLQRVISEGTLRVNAHGFPLQVFYKTVRHLAGLGDEAYTIRHELSDDRKHFETSIAVRGQTLRHKTSIHDHETIDRQARAGLFAFVPMQPGCAGRRVVSYTGMSLSPGGAPVQTGLSPPRAGQLGMPKTVRIVENADCEESMFANPGLLSLAMPALWEANGEREYVFFTPIGPPNPYRKSSRVSIGSTSLAPAAGGSRFLDILRRAGIAKVRPGTYREIETLTFRERVDVKMGRRTHGAWRLEMSSGYGPVYVGDDGRVLRIDLPTPEGWGQRHIRMLWPSEY